MKNCLMSKKPRPTKQRMYIYLAKRDKKGVIVVAIFNGLNPQTKRIVPNDVNKFGLSAQFREEFKRVFYENRIKYEPWMEPAANYAELVNKLRKRGYKNISEDGTPMFDDIFDITMFGDEDNVDTSKMTSKKTMIRKIK